MVFPAAALGVLSGASGIASALGGFFDNSAANQAHAANQQKVAQINAENQRRLFQQLQVNAGFANRKAKVQANLDNIEVAGMTARAKAQRNVDDVIDNFVKDRESSYAKMAQNMSGNKYRDRANRAMMGRATSGGLAAIRKAQNRSMTDDRLLDRTMQEARAKELSTVATAPIQTKFIESYTPQRAPQKGFMDYLNLAAGIGSSVVGGFNTFDQFKPKSPYSGGGSSLKIGGVGNGFDPSTFELGMNSGQFSYDY
tara:strand:+ start:392 stop:1156 length:765 start_codon:yes stop_codon:yes gene_type:complete